MAQTCPSGPVSWQRHAPLPDPSWVPSGKRILPNQLQATLTRSSGDLTRSSGTEGFRSETETQPVAHTCPFPHWEGLYLNSVVKLSIWYKHLREITNTVTLYRGSLSFSGREISNLPLECRSSFPFPPQLQQEGLHLP